ncbi:MAG: hypothetical protein ACXABK_05120 [Candidatus Heimdallarchaeaceae archaeon]|jgi:uncharacterized membrane protein YciS (DUF1049 family)
MVSAAYVLMLVVFSTLIVVGIGIFSIFWYKVIIQLRAKKESKTTTKKIDLDDSIYTRMADDPEATEQYVYMRRKLTGG